MEEPKSTSFVKGGSLRFGERRREDREPTVVLRTAPGLRTPALGTADAGRRTSVVLRTPTPSPLRTTVVLGI